MTGRKRRWLEPVKSALIVLLSASALLLMYLSGLLDFLAPERGNGAFILPDEPSLSLKAAVFPAEAAITGQSGLCYGLKYDSAALRELFDSVSPYLGEAVGSAEAPKRISEKRWLKLLGGAGLYLDYDCDLPLNLLAAWLGVEAPMCPTFHTLILSEGETGNVLLSFLDEKDKGWSCETAGAWKSLAGQLDAYRPNGASFAQSWAALKLCAPAMLVLESLPELYAVSVSDGQKAAAEALAEKTGIHLNSVSRYSEPDGTVVYPGENGVLRLHIDGSLSFSVSDTFRLAEGNDLPAITELSRTLLEELHAAFAGDEELRCDGCHIGSDGSGEVTFSYVCEGLPVLLRTGSAARLRWTEGRLTELVFLPRCCRISDRRVELLPEKQAAAAAGSRSPGAEAGLALYDSGEALLDPFWRVVPARN